MADSTAETFGEDYDANLVKAVYKTTWNDFYSWEHAHCLQTLHSLARTLSQDAPPSPYDSVEDLIPTTASFILTDSESSDSDDETIITTDYTGPHGPQTATVKATTVQFTRPMEPCAAYEMCTPTGRNINVGDDSEYMPFIPLIDDPEFNFLRHAEDYKYFEWQLPFRDPDLEVIVTYTVYTLHHDHQLSFNTIEETRLLPLPIQPHILTAARRRDFPKWPTIKAPPYSPPHANASAPRNLANLVNDFCSNQNCLIGYCTVHIGDIPMPELVAPTISSEDLVHSVEVPCGSECFLLNKPSTVTTIRRPLRQTGLVRIQGHATPARTARVSKTRRTANEAADATENASAAQKAATALNRSSRKRAGRPDVRVIVHTGNVILRFASSAKQDSESDICKNAFIQRGARKFAACNMKHTHVRQSKWGLGLYISEEAKEGDFILGSLFVSKHRGRNYLFQLNSTFSVDSTKAGNESRFINHDPDANCHACVRLVNGEHRIGIFAQRPILPGAELHLDYGDLFFEADGSDSGPEEANAASKDVQPPPPDFSQEKVVYNLDQHSSDETYETHNSEFDLTPPGTP
ncbi:hypothetical protein C0991_008420 [Blastosporella zonata]|nr:hypothetical protein C0991_008420 [Blastosporella zonata]